MDYFFLLLSTFRNLRRWFLPEAFVSATIRQKTPHNKKHRRGVRPWHLSPSPAVLVRPVALFALPSAFHRLNNLDQNIGVRERDRRQLRARRLRVLVSLAASVKWGFTTPERLALSSPQLSELRYVVPKIKHYGVLFQQQQQNGHVEKKRHGRRYALLIHCFTKKKRDAYHM